MSRDLRRHLEERLSTYFGRRLTLSTDAALASGRLETAEGPVFLKLDRTMGSTAPEAEAACLEALAQVKSKEIAIPAVIGFMNPSSDHCGFLMTEYVASLGARTEAEECLGRGLADLHRNHSASFGFSCSTYCGATIQPNTHCDDWVEFFAQRRIGHLARRLFDASRISSSEFARYERLIERLPEWLSGTQEVPSLIHGDLWAGNVLWSKDRPHLIDPSCAFAHREAELGMMTLFGGFSKRVYDAYQESFPLIPGWRERNDLYRLYHLLNHALLFGGGYVAEARAIAQHRVG